MKMTRPLNWAGWFGLPPALLLVPLACFGISPSAKENPRFATDASEIRMDFPQLFGGNRIDMVKPKSVAGEFVGLPGRGPVRFAAHARSLISGMPRRTQEDPDGPRGACESSTSDLCYSLADGRIVYRPARQYMPKFDGLTAENISLRRNAIRFKYSFK